MTTDNENTLERLTPDDIEQMIGMIAAIASGDAGLMLKRLQLEAMTVLDLIDSIEELELTFNRLDPEAILGAGVARRQEGDFLLSMPLTNDDGSTSSVRVEFSFDPTTDKAQIKLCALYEP
ncbi:MAG: hypothetical protein R3D67_22330 [Hyphomicrobiaceae bacterium]